LLTVDLASISSLATAAGTLVLAVATFASVRSANRAARAAERSLLAGLRPLLLPSDLHDTEQKVLFIDRKWVIVPGGCGAAEYENENVYLAASFRNAGPGLALQHGWYFHHDYDVDAPVPELSRFRRLTRDLYIPPGGIGYWQGALREPSEPDFQAARKLIEGRSPILIDLLYGDSEGGQRTITRFTLQPRESGGWLLTVSRHRNVDRPSPR
jgi:hypothetical protein